MRYTSSHGDIPSDNILLLQMYPLLERISPRTRKLELFARMHNTHAGYNLIIFNLLDMGIWMMILLATYPILFGMTYIQQFS